MVHTEKKQIGGIKANCERQSNCTGELLAEVGKGGRSPTRDLRAVERRGKKGTMGKEAN